MKKCSRYLSTFLMQLISCRLSNSSFVYMKHLVIILVNAHFNDHLFQSWDMIRHHSKMLTLEMKLASLQWLSQRLPQQPLLKTLLSRVAKYIFNFRGVSNKPDPQIYLGLFRVGFSNFFQPIFSLSTGKILLFQFSLSMSGVDQMILYAPVYLPQILIEIFSTWETISSTMFGDINFPKKNRCCNTCWIFPQPDSRD